MPFLQGLLANDLFIRLDGLYRAFIHAAGAEVNGPAPEEDAKPSQEELELQCVTPRVLEIIRQAELLVSDADLLKAVYESDRLGLQSKLTEVLRALRTDIGSFYSTLLKQHHTPLQVNGHEKYPDLMKEIEEAEKKIIRFRIPEPFKLLPLPSGSGPTRKEHGLYSYDDVPLPTISSIRLVSMEPTPNKDIHVSLHTVYLRDNPKYTTLSYTWGPPLNIFRTKEERRETQSQLDDPRMVTTVPILCNGSPLRVTENLYRFLCHWRDGSIHARFDESSKGAREIWIDAICINQNDIEEKNSQVARMGEIYSKSQGVYIWLGDEDCFSRLAIPLINELAMFKGDWNSLRELGSARAEQELLDRGLPPILSWDYMSLFAFLKRAWFQRAWVCQEVAFAPEISIFCGKANIPDWRILTSAAMYLFLTSLAKVIDYQAAAEILGEGFGDFTDHGPEKWYDFSHPRGDPSSRKLFYSDSVKSDLPSGVAVLHLNSIRKADPSKAPVGAPVTIIEPAAAQESILQLFTTARGMKATNPRDKIYAFLDLAKRPYYDTIQPHPGRRGLQPKYQLEVKDVYLEASWYILLTEQDLGLLAYSQERETLNEDLPSWAPDWGSLTTTNSFTRPLEEASWTASGNSAWEVPEQKLYQPWLLVHGWRVSSISAAAQGDFCLSKAALVAADTPDIYEWTPGGQSRVEALWRTLVADHVDRQSPAPSYCEQDFRRKWTFELDAARRCEEGRKVFGFFTLPRSEKSKTTLRRFERAEEKLRIGLEQIPDMDQEIAPANMFNFLARYNQTSFMRTVFRTDADHLGNGPRQLMVGDQVWILAGASVPFVLRPRSYGGYQLIGEAYVHGIMRGEALDKPGAKSEQIELI